MRKLKRSAPVCPVSSVVSVEKLEPGNEKGQREPRSFVIAQPSVVPRKYQYKIVLKFFLRWEVEPNRSEDRKESEHNQSTIVRGVVVSKGRQ